MQKASKIFLIGFMGSGKSTTGKNLASFLKWSFIDLDERIEKLAGLTIPEIFSDKGEHCFRQIESEALLNMANESKTVISTGGGTPCFEANLDFMLDNGLTVYLKLTPAQLKRRLINNSDERPLLKDIDKKGLIDFITRKLSEREKWYNRAEIITDGFNTRISALYDLIKDRII